MALRRWLTIAIGWGHPRPAALPVMRPLVVLAPNIRTAELWLYEEGLRASGRIRLVTPDRPERLRGMSPQVEIVWVHGDWEFVPIDRFTQLHEYVGMLVSFGATERDVVV
jgi:hypothetical protein